VDDTGTVPDLLFVADVAVADTQDQADTTVFVDTQPPAVQDTVVGDTTQPAVPDVVSSDVLPQLDGNLPADVVPGDTATAKSIGETCFGEIWDPEIPGPDYDQFNPVIGSHCQGTNHQDIVGVERVVFLGDSVTVGTPPTPMEDMYRNALAQKLSTHFNLSSPNFLWATPNPLDGKTILKESGDFASCARWGARTDDLMLDGDDQVPDCFPKYKRQLRTLVVITIGGNDIAALTKDGASQSYQTSFEQTQTFVQYLHDAVAWLKDPINFPNGSYVVFANMFEFTDGTGETNACALASLGGFDGQWDKPEDLEDLVIWANEQYMKIAVETQSDMIFMLEHFCGHGFKHKDPKGRCYRGPQAANWFDFTCIHPNPVGHGVITKMFEAIVME